MVMTLKGRRRKRGGKIGIGLRKSTKGEKRINKQKDQERK